MKYQEYIRGLLGRCLMCCCIAMCLYGMGCSGAANTHTANIGSGASIDLTYPVGWIVSVETNESGFKAFYIVQLSTNLKTGTLLGSARGRKQLELVKMSHTNEIFVGRCCLTPAGDREVLRSYKSAPKVGDSVYIYLSPR
jgi:hypothetical protein